MTVELKSTFIPKDLHRWLKQLSLDNDTTVQAEVERALREAQAMREQGTTPGGAGQRQTVTAAVAQ